MTETRQHDHDHGNGGGTPRTALPDDAPASDDAILPVEFPHLPECRNCAVRLKETMEGTSGVRSIEADDEGQTLTIHYDPTVVDPESLEETAKSTRGQLDRDYCHHTFVLDGLDCADCARTVESVVTKRQGVLYAAVNFASSRLFLEFHCAEADMEEIFEDVRNLGYGISSEEEYQTTRRRGPARPFYLRNRRALVTAASFVLFGIGAAVWLTTAEPHTVAIGFLLAAIVIGGYSVARNGMYAVLRSRRVDMNVLMTLAVIGAAAIGEWVEGALVVVLFGLGETLETWAVERTRGSIQELMDITPEEAVVLHDGHEERVPVEEVTVGQQVVVRPGGRIPLDGMVVDGRSGVDESAITGESIPREKGPDDTVYAGTMNQRGTLTIRVTSIARESTLARIIQMVEEAQGKKAPAQRWVDSFARYYTPAVLGLAVLTTVVPPLAFGAAWGDWIYRGLALLILSCPCALVISTPVSIVSAIGAASRQGVLIKGGAHLETAGNLKVVTFDKTGTLTVGRPRVTEVLAFDGEPEDGVLALAAAVEHGSEHPLAGAVLEEARSRGVDFTPAADFEALSGMGARATLNGGTYYVGNARLFEDKGIPLEKRLLSEVSWRQDRGETVVLVGNEEQGLGAISIADELRPFARRAVQALREAGIEKVFMLTGDNRQTASAVATDLGLDGFHYELLPAAKVKALEELLDEHGQVAMVGDGINDAPALARSTVGIAMGAAGTDTALETADIALMTDDLSRVSFTIHLSRAARKIVRQNIGFALGVKALATVLVFPGLLTLWMAVLADTGASLLVIGNGLRLLRHGRSDSGDEGATPDEPPAAEGRAPAAERPATPVAATPVAAPIGDGDEESCSGDCHCGED